MNTMNDTEIRIAMAELEGWSRGYTGAGGRTEYFVVDPHGFQRGWSKLQEVADSALPDYCNDLNAVHRVENKLVLEQSIKYVVFLKHVVRNQWPSKLDLAWEIESARTLKDAAWTAIDAWMISRATAMRELVAEYAERERVAIASWDEERQRALREADRVVVKDAENARLREQVKHLEETGEAEAAIDADEKKRLRERVAELERSNEAYHHKALQEMLARGVAETQLAAARRDAERLPSILRSSVEWDECRECYQWVIRAPKGDTSKSLETVLAAMQREGGK